MRQSPARVTLVLLAALSLAACAARHEGAVTAVGNDDDDSYCRANNTVGPGSPEYVACRKDRDVQRQRAESRADRRQRDLGEYMMNHPDHPQAGGSDWVRSNPADSCLCCTNLHLSNSFGGAVQFGFDYMLDRHWRLNVDVKKLWLRPDYSATVNNVIPVTGRANIDPWLVGAGVTSKF